MLERIHLGTDIAELNGGQRRKSRRGFACMDIIRQRQIASKGGRAAHAKGTAHEFDSAEARMAGRKGGLSVSQDRAHMAEIGRHGGLMRGERARRSSSVPQGGALAALATGGQTPAHMSV